ALVLGMGLYFIFISIFGNLKIAMVLGILGALAGGYGGGIFLGGSDY
ncbi:unnamed protein product, partial [marine sediment metagenome]